MKEETLMGLGMISMILGSAAIGFALGASVGIHETKYVKSTLSDWEVFELAVMKTESEFDSLAVGKSKDIGLFQITPIYVDELNRLGKDTTFIHTQAFSPSTAIEMFNRMQDYKNPSKNIDKAIQIHNPKGDSIGYAKRVKENIAFIKKYEDIRNKVKEWHESEMK